MTKNELLKLLQSKYKTRLSRVKHYVSFSGIACLILYSKENMIVDTCFKTHLIEDFGFIKGVVIWNAAKKINQ